MVTFLQKRFLPLTTPYLYSTQPIHNFTQSPNLPYLFLFPVTISCLLVQPNPLLAHRPHRNSFDSNFFLLSFTGLLDTVYYPVYIAFTPVHHTTIKYLFFCLSVLHYNKGTLPPLISLFLLEGRRKDRDYVRRRFKGENYITRLDVRCFGD